MTKLSRVLMASAAFLFTISIPSQAQTGAKEKVLPELHKIQHITLSPSYSCRPKEEFRKGFERTALFLSEDSRNRKRPELLFNGACKSPDTFGAQVGGDDFDVIADYGDVPLENLTLHHAFS